MKKRPDLLVFLLFSITILYSCRTQTFQCDYFRKPDSKSNIAEILNSSSDSDPSFQAITTKIIDLSFPYRGFTLKEDNTGSVEIAKVINGKNLNRYLLYNRAALSNVTFERNEENIKAICVIAHEIAHLMYGHGVSNSRQKNHDNELLADNYSGYVLRRLGFSDRGACISIIDQLISHENSGESLTHPSKIRRKTAIGEGWDMASNDPKFSRNAYDVFCIDSLIITRSRHSDPLLNLDLSIKTYDEEDNQIDYMGIYNKLNLNVEQENVGAFYNILNTFANKKFHKLIITIGECPGPGPCTNLTRQPWLIPLLASQLKDDMVVPVSNFGKLYLKFH